MLNEAGTNSMANDGKVDYGRSQPGDQKEFLSIIQKLSSTVETLTETVASQQHTISKLIHRE